jgi:hypothetical protein
VIPLFHALLRLAADLRALDARWALVGGMAVSVLTEPRTTKDVDVVIAVPGEPEAERLVLALRFRGYCDYLQQPLLQEKGTGRLMGVRLLAPVEAEEDLIVDLLFGIAGVEAEIVAAARMLELARGIRVPVARAGHVLALKVLAGRPIDQADAQRLLATLSTEELQRAKETLDLISRRGFDEGKDLFGSLARLMSL